MDILVLGDSDSSGALTGGLSWVQLLEASLRTSDPVASVRSIGFSAVPRSAPAYAERKVSELQPDTVIVMVGAWGFTYTMVQLQVEALFGERVAGCYRWLEAKFESSTRAPGAKPSGVNRIARVLLRRVIGARAQATRAELTERYGEVLRRLARFEDTEVVVMTYQGIGDHATTGKLARQRKRFFADIQRAAEAHHYAWVHEPGLFAEFSDWHEYAIDELHFNTRGHQMLLGTIEPVVRELAQRH